MFRRPSLMMTLFPVLAFVAGVMVGKYLPLGFLPGPQPGEERDAPSLGEALSDLLGNVGKRDQRHAEAEESATGEDELAPAVEDTTEAEASAPPETSDGEHARAFVSEPVLVVDVRSANTFVVQNRAGRRHLLRLAGVPEEREEVARELLRFDGYYLAVDLASPPLDETGRLHGVAYVQPRGWQPGQPVDRSPERSLNDVLRRALEQHGSH